MRTALTPLVWIASAAAAWAAASVPGEPPPAPPDHEPRKRALIVAISDYSPDTGWGPISSKNDVPLVRAALEHHGFAGDEIEVLKDDEATRTRIEAALRDTLISPAGPGDILFFHYSGHGQRITDDGTEEIDGYDEAIVPYDAPMRESDAYHGEKHIRDDQLSALFNEMRAQAGPTGNVVAFFDSCHSGAISRGQARARGGPPFGEPRSEASTRAAGREATGFLETPTARGATAPAPVDLAPIAVMSASRYDQLTWETSTPDGQAVGPLSFAVNSVLLARGPETTYRTVYEETVRILQSRVSNEPQIEGDVDTRIFNGRAVPQRGFLTVKSVEEGSRITLAAGSLHGVLRGAEFELHAAGTGVPSDGSKLAEGTVVSASPLSATATLGEGAVASLPSRDRLLSARAFVTHYAFGDLRIKVSLAGVPAPPRPSIEAGLGNVAAVEISDESPDVVVVQEDVAGAPSILVRVAATGLTLLGPLNPASASLGGQISVRLEDFAHNRYMRRLSLSHPHYDARLEVRPVRCPPGQQPNHTTCTEEFDIEELRGVGQQIEPPAGTYFKLLVHPGARPHYAAVLDLAPDGTIVCLWPPPGRQERIDSQRPFLIPQLFQFDEPLGLDTFLLVSTQEWVDFSPFETAPDVRGRSALSRSVAERGNLGPFAPLFDDAAVRTRAKVVTPRGAASTHRLVFRVIPGPDGSN